MDIAIRVEGLGKRYTINRTAAATTLREQMTSGIARLFGQRSDVGELLPHDEAEPRTAEQEYWALKDVSFEVMSGERIGIIGQNGAGKSTLLKILSRVTSPTEGRIEIRGKVSSLLEVGTGFHPELTGRENIYLNGAILGMSRQEIRKKLDQIVSFSGVERFIDTPVKHYSSGMYVRLAFSVSAWLDPDILILDEVLSVGDQAFQRKCAERMRELTREGRTVVVVSHSMATINQMCQRALYLERGRVISFDAVQEATVEYQRDVVQEIEQHQEGPWHRSHIEIPDDRIEVLTERKGEAELLSASIHVVGKDPADVLPMDAPLHVEMHYRLLRDLPFPVVPNFHLFDEFGGRILITMPEQLPSSAAGDYVAICVLPAYTLNFGRFIMMVALSSFTEQPQVHFAATETLRFEITEDGVQDPRRHGFRQHLPGFTRARLDWIYQAS